MRALSHTTGWPTFAIIDTHPASPDFASLIRATGWVND